MLTFAFAMAVHFLVTDYSLREHHKQAYDQVGRWLVSLALMAGWAVGLAAETVGRCHRHPSGLPRGGVILNVLKEELPSERRSRFVPFLAGATSYAALLLVV
ncbi:MAG TPA: hypothetical protein VM386_07135 [Acidimicrobiales bacterium]|nr:hypothetical protein [Acidimicrobiales bacterium]